MNPPPGKPDIMELLFELGIVLGISALIGLERQLSSRNDRIGAGGIRTFVLVGILGFLVTIPEGGAGLWLNAAGLLALTLLLSIRHLSHAQDGRKGVTTEVSLILTFILGMLVHLKYTVFAVAVALLMSFIMSIKLKIETIVEQVTEEELFAVFKFVVAGALILPLLPDRTIDPWGVINPSEVWTVVVLVLSLSFVGYLLMKFWSARQGIMLTGFLGGLVSSTVVTWLFSGKSRQDPANARAYAQANLLAIAIMFARALVLTYIMNAGLGMRLALPLMLLFAVEAVAAYGGYRRLKAADGAAPGMGVLGNPFNIGDAAKFAAIYVIILVLVSLSNARFGSAGVYAVSALSGLASVDAIVISMARLAGGQVSTATALNAIMIAALSNNVVKLGIALARGSSVYRINISWGISLVFAAAGAWYLLIGW